VYNNDHNSNDGNAKKPLIVLTEQREILLVPSQVLATCPEMLLLEIQTLLSQQVIKYFPKIISDALCISI